MNIKPFDEILVQSDLCELLYFVLEFTQNWGFHVPSRIKYQLYSSIFYEYISIRIQLKGSLIGVLFSSHLDNKQICALLSTLP